MPLPKLKYGKRSHSAASHCFSAKKPSAGARPQRAAFQNVLAQNVLFTVQSLETFECRDTNEHPLSLNSFLLHIP